MADLYRNSTIVDTGGVGPPAMAEAASAIVEQEGKKTMILFGGWIGTEGTCSGCTWSYDLAGKKWSKAAIVSSECPQARCNTAYCSTDATLTLFGGQDSNHTLHNDLWSATLKSTESNEVAWAEHKCTNPPTPRCGASLCHDNGFLYLFGGTDGKSRLNDLHCFCIETSTWTEVNASGTIPPPTDGHSMVADPTENRLILFGGFSETHCGNLYTFQTKDSVWVSEPRLQQTPSPRNTHRCHLLGGEQPVLVIIMGYNGAELSDVWEIDPTQLTSCNWVNRTFTGDWPLCPRRYHSTCSSDSRVILFGGWDGKHYLDSTVELDFSKPSDSAAAKKK